MDLNMDMGLPQDFST